MLRGLGGDGGKIMALGYDERDELETTRDRAEQTLLGVSQRLRGVNFVPMRTVVQQFFDAAQSDVGVQPRYVRMASRKIYFRRGRTSVDYATWVKIPAHPVTFTEDDRPQSYKLVGTVTYHAPLGQPVPRTSGANDLAFQSHVLLVTPLVYREPTGLLGSLTGTVDGPELQFYIVG